VPIEKEECDLPRGLLSSLKKAACDAGRGCNLGRVVCLIIVDEYLAIRVLITLLGVRFFCGLWRKVDAQNSTFETKGTGEESPFN